MKDLINASGLELRMATSTTEGAGLASRTGYNGMNWTRVFSLLLHDVGGAQPVAFSEKMWQTMLQCQGGRTRRSYPTAKTPSGFLAFEDLQVSRRQRGYKASAFCFRVGAWQSRCCGFFVLVAPLEG